MFEKPSTEQPVGPGTGWCGEQRDSIQLGARGGAWAFPHLMFQERVNKRQKKTAPTEEDDSGVEVYYREGEEEIEETKVQPKVKANPWFRERMWGGRFLGFLP